MEILTSWSQNVKKRSRKRACQQVVLNPQIADEERIQKKYIESNFKEAFIYEVTLLGSLLSRGSLEKYDERGEGRGNHTYFQPSLSEIVHS